MDLLDAAEKAALQSASVFGQRYPLPGLRHLIDKPDYDCGTLVAHRLVRPQDDHYRFSHALIRDAVYDSLLKRRRQELHGKAGDWYGTREPGLRAEHLDRADDEGAAAAYLAAAEVDADALRFERALGLADRGYALARTDDERFGLGMLRARLLRELSL